MTASPGRRSARWPYAAPAGEPLPPTLPDGSPWPRISIVTPSFNQGRFLEETILSVLRSGYPDVEHLVIDGGSTDETGAVLDRYRDRLAYLESEKDRGQSHALNKGFARATGEILTWLNSDDMLAPGALPAVALAFHLSRADLVAGVAQLFQDGVLVDQHVTSCADGPLPLDDLLDLDACWNGGQFFYQPEVMFTRAIWEKAGGRVDESAFYSMDYELWLRFAEHRAKLKVIGRPVAHFRVHPAQKTNDPSQFKAELPSVRDAFLERTGHVREPRTLRTRSAFRAVFFNDIGEKHGAGIAHGRLAESLARAGHDVSLIAAATDHAAVGLPLAESRAILDAIAAKSPDLVVFGNLHAASLDADLVGLVADRWPSAFVLHDLWLLTGRCAYTHACMRYTEGCDDRCPTPTEYPELPPERIAPAWTQKRRVLTASKRPPALLANSRWTAEIARGAFAGGAAPPIDSIHLAFPLDVFRPRDKRICRELLEIPADAFVILCSGTSVSDPRKGFSHLLTALERLKLPDVLLVSLGHIDAAARAGSLAMKAMGFVDDPHRLAMLYSAADLFVGPSFEEGFGQVFVEAAACGTPSIGYPVGGIPEAILDGVTGRLAKQVHPADLADAILELYQDPALHARLSRFSRIVAENEWSMEAAYRRFYQALVSTGLAATLDLSRKISFPPAATRPAPARFVDSSLVAWRAVSGFGPWEGPFAEWKLPICRWAMGPVSRMEVMAPEGGRQRIFVRCRNFHPGQRVRIVHGGKIAGETELPVSQDHTDHFFDCEIDAVRGPNLVELDFWRWTQARDEKPRAILVSGVALGPA